MQSACLEHNPAPSLVFDKSHYAQTRLNERQSRKQPELNAPSSATRDMQTTIRGSFFPPQLASACATKRMARSGPNPEYQGTQCGGAPVWWHVKHRLTGQRICEVTRGAARSCARPLGIRASPDGARLPATTPTRGSQACGRARIVLMTLSSGMRWQ